MRECLLALCDSCCCVLHCAHVAVGRYSPCAEESGAAQEAAELQEELRGRDGEIASLYRRIDEQSTKDVALLDRVLTLTETISTLKCQLGPGMHPMLSFKRPMSFTECLC